MKKLFIIFVLFHFINLKYLVASSTKTICGPYINLVTDKWLWNKGCNGCFYRSAHECTTYNESSNFLCFFRVGICENNGENGLQGSNNNNASFFNLREKPTKKYSQALQTRAVNNAISITENDFLNLIQPNKVQTTISFASTQSITFNVGVADNTNPQTWIIPSLSNISRGVEQLYFVTPSSIPAGAQVVGATHVGKKEIVDEENNILTEYTHFKFEVGQDLEEMGSSFINQNTGNIVNHGESTAQIYADSPLDLDDAFTTEIVEFYDDEEILPFDFITTDVTVDAFGTINDPSTGATYNCLRMALEETIEEYETDEDTPDNTTTNRYYMWVTKEGFRFIVKDPGASSTVNEISMVKFSTATTLDVELLDFKGITKNKTAELTWLTANENNNKGFEIERSTDGKQFENIGFVKGNGTTRVKQAYDFTDEKPLLKTTYYRLQQVDFDNSKVSSNVITIEPKEIVTNLKIYPNPTNGNEITLELPENTEGVEIINSLGQTIFSKKTTNIQTLQVDINQWSQGLYFIKSGSEMAKLVKSN